MKFANLCDHASTSVNIGDYLQFSMISKLYERMGISESEIYYLSGKNIENYQGETLLLPLNFIATIFMHNNRITISKDIVPVFIALSLSNMKEKLDLDEIFSNQENRDFFMKYSPIGCRDEYTYHIFRQQGIPAYLNGCLTATLPRRKETKLQNKVFFVDTPERLQSFIPKELFDDCEFVSQQAQFSEEELRNYNTIFEFINKRYSKYAEEARLIVTSRLHVAVPCTAMGIPVVFVKDYIDTRFSWLEKLIPLYDLEHYSEIDWNPKVPEYEEQKERIISLAINRVQFIYNLSNAATMLDDFYLSRNALAFYYDSHDITHKNTKYLELYAQKYWLKKEHLKFGLWGITANSTFWIKWIAKHYPYAEFTIAVDSFKEGEICGIPICKPEILQPNTDCCMIVVAVSAVPSALQLFKKLAYTPSDYCIAVDAFITEKPMKN